MITIKKGMHLWREGSNALITPSSPLVNTIDPSLKWRCKNPPETDTSVEKLSEVYKMLNDTEYFINKYGPVYQRIPGIIEHDNRRRLKPLLPLVYFGGIFNYPISDGTLVRSSGFMCFDFDNVDIVSGFDGLTKLKSAVAVWVSPSGNGLRLLIRYNFDFGEDLRKYSDGYKLIGRQIVETTGLAIDNSCNDITRGIFLTPSKNWFNNSRPEPVLNLSQVPDRQPQVYNKINTNHNYIELINNNLNKAIELSDNYDSWYKIILALGSEQSNEALSAAHYFSSLVPSKYNAANTDKVFKTFKNKSTSVKIGTFYYLLTH